MAAGFKADKEKTSKALDFDIASDELIFHARPRGVKYICSLLC